MVRVRRRPGTLVWAVILLAAAMAFYLYALLSGVRRVQTEETGVLFSGERVTREVKIEPLQTYLVSFGGYDVENQAKIEAARYVSRGAAGYILDGEQLLVIGAGYGEEEQAEKVCAQLEAEEGMSCRTVSMESPSVSLRMTAGEKQIEAFVLGEQALRSAASALQQLAFSVDRGDATAEQAGEVIETYLEKISGAYERLVQQTEGRNSEIFQSLEEMLADMLDQMKEMLQEGKPLFLSSRLKYCYVDFSVREIEWINRLNG